MSGRRLAPWTMLVGLAAAGCAHGGATVSPLFHPALIAADTGLIYVYRAGVAHEEGSRKQIRALPVFVDDLPLGWFSRAGYVPLHVRPGDHVLKVMVAGRAHAVSLRIEPNGEYFVRYEVSPTGASLKPVPSSDGRAEIAGCSLLPGGYDGRDRI